MRKASIIFIFTCVAIAASMVATAQPARGGGRGFGRQSTPPGPPAPVPASVAVERPSEKELITLRAELEKFLENGSPEHQALLQKYASLVKVNPPRENPCIRPSAGAHARNHERFVEIAQNEEFDLLFLGDSITDLLNVDADPQGNPGGKPFVEKYFAGVKYANFGASGDQTQGVLWGLQNGEGQGHQPKAVTMMIGTNNTTSGATGPEIAEGIGAIVLELRKDFPDAKILVVSIFPRGSSAQDANRKKVEVANDIIKNLDDGEHVFVMNINDKFLKEDGSLIGFRPTDNLHPVEEGFDIWMSSIAPTLKSWLEE